MKFRLLLLLSVLTLGACSKDPEEAERREKATKYYRTTNTVIQPTDDIISFEPPATLNDSRPPANPVPYL